MTVYALFIAFALLVCALGFVESWREDRRKARDRHPSARGVGGGRS